ncbi:MAG: 50S ribosomal protein L4 [Rickettsiales bacterium]|nr:50S ribosomal protein L4 [Rickettsiales bacterium]
MKVKVFSLENGSELNSEVDLRDDVFGLPYDNKFMSMYFARMKSASYVPTNKTKNISEVSGTTKKPFKQKHTGNARQGSMRSAQMRGGGIAFGPRAMQGFVKIPKGEAILAKSMLLSNAFANGCGFVIDKAHFNSCRTKEAKKILSKFSPKSVVIIHNGGVDANSLLAVRNLQGVKFVSQNMLTANDLVYANAVLIDVNAVETLSKVLYVDYEGDNN